MTVARLPSALSVISILKIAMIASFLTIAADRASAQIPGSKLYVLSHGVDTMQYSSDGTLGLIGMNADNLSQITYRFRAPGQDWRDEAVTTFNNFDAEFYGNPQSTNMNYGYAAALLYDAQGTPHVFEGDGTYFNHWVRTGPGQWSLLESFVAPPSLATDPDEGTSMGTGSMAVAIDSAGYFHLVYEDGDDPSETSFPESSPALQVLYANNRSGTWQWEVAVPQSSAGLNDVVDYEESGPFGPDFRIPRMLSLAVDASGNAYITFCPEYTDEGTGGVVQSDLWYASDVSGTWTSEQVETFGSHNGDYGFGASIAVSPTGQVAIAGFGIPRVATGSTAGPASLRYDTLKPDGTWSHQTVSSTADGYIAGDGQRGTGWTPYLLFDIYGNPHILFCDHASQHFSGAGDLCFGGNLREATQVKGKWNLATLFRQTNPIANQVYDPVLAVSSSSYAYFAISRNDQLGADLSIESSSYGEIFHELSMSSAPVIDGTFTGNMILGQNDPAPGVDGGKFVLADSPAVDDSGDIIFKGYVGAIAGAAPIKSADKTGIWFYSGTAGTLLERTGSSAAGTSGAVFSSLGDPVAAHDGSAAFIGALTGGDVAHNKSNATGVWVLESGSAQLAARSGDTAAGESAASYAQFEEIVTEQPGEPAFLAKLGGAGVKGTSNLGLWGVDLSGTQDEIVRTGDLLSTGAGQGAVKSISVFQPSKPDLGQSRGIDTVNGLLAFGLSFPDHASGLYLATPGVSGFAVENLAATWDASVPGVSNAVYSGFGSPIVNEAGTVAYRATLAGASKATKIPASQATGIWLETSTSNVLVARTGSTAPGTVGATFAKLNDPVLNNDGDVAFIGTLVKGSGSVTAASNSGLWSGSNGTVQLVAQTSGDAPGLQGVTFREFDEVVLPDGGGPVFVAKLGDVPASESNSVWDVDSDGQVHLLLRTGDAVSVHGAVRTVTSFSIFSVSPGVEGQSRNFDGTTRSVVFLATLNDGTWAILQTTAP